MIFIKHMAAVIKTYNQKRTWPDQRTKFSVVVFMFSSKKDPRGRWIDNLETKPPLLVNDYVDYDNNDVVLVMIIMDF